MQPNEDAQDKTDEFDTPAAGSDAGSDGETNSGPSTEQTDEQEADQREYYEIQGKLQAAHRATLHMPDGTDIELDLEEKHQDGTAEYEVWGIEDTDPEVHDSQHFRNRLRLFCDARIIGASDDSDGLSTTVTVDLDTSEAEHQLSDLREEIEDLQMEIQRLNKRLNGLVHGPERSRVGAKR